MKRYSVAFVFGLALCFVIQAAALKVVGGRNIKNESNFFSSLGRIQAAADSPPPVLMLGSSLTGRLPDRLQGYEDFANMGCDGGSAMDVLRAIDRGDLPGSRFLVVETNTLHRDMDPVPSVVASAMSRPWFRVGKQFPLLSAYARPSGFFYSFLLQRKIGAFGAYDATADLRVQNLPGKPDENITRVLDDKTEDLIEEVAGIARRLRSKGTDIIFVWLPPDRKNGGPPPAWILKLVKTADSHWWDIGGEADPSLVSLTDGAHMSVDSAARTVVTLQKGIEMLEKTN